MDEKYDAQNLNKDEIDHLRHMIAAYTESIRATDIKSNIVAIFQALSFAPIFFIQEKTHLMLGISSIMIFPMMSVLNLLLSIFPRYSRSDEDFFHIRARPSVQHFSSEEPKNPGQQLIARCLSLSQILFWKTFFFRLGITFCIMYISLLLILFIISVYNDGFQGQPRV